MTPDPVRRQRIVMTGALAAVYIVWGSTYLALRYGLEGGFPPFLLNGVRFISAGGILYVALRVRGHAAPSAAQWANAAKVGVLLLVGGVGLVTIAEDLGVGSGVAATAVAVIPMWSALTAGLWGNWPGRREWLGLATGLAGVVILGLEGDFQASGTGLALVVVAPMLWSFGSVWGTRLDMAPGAMATASQLLAGGVALAVIGPLRGERLTAMPEASAWLALAYLTLLGSVVAYTAYQYLLHTVRPALATSYAYVNPVVAVVLGLTLGNETITGPALLALPVILAGVALVAMPPRRRPARPLRRLLLRRQPA